MSKWKIKEYLSYDGEDLRGGFWSGVTVLTAFFSVLMHECFKLGYKVYTEQFLNSLVIIVGWSVSVAFFAFFAYVLYKADWIIEKTEIRER